MKSKHNNQENNFMSKIATLRKNSKFLHKGLTEASNLLDRKKSDNIKQHRRFIRDFSLMASTIATLVVLLYNADIYMPQIEIFKSKIPLIAGLISLLLTIVSSFSLLKFRIEKENKIIGKFEYKHGGNLYKLRQHQLLLNELLRKRNKELFERAVESEKALYDALLKDAVKDIKPPPKPTLNIMFDLIFVLFIIALILIAFSFSKKPDILWSKMVKSSTENTSESKQEGI